MRLEMTVTGREKGITLIELVVVIAITGILTTTLIKMYQVAMISFENSSRQSSFLNHTARFIQQISKDVHEAKRIQGVANKQIVLLGKKKRIQYSIKESGKKVVVIRKIQSSKHSDWIQQPRFPVAEFPNIETTSKSVVVFQKKRASLELKISDPDHTVETTISSRCDD